MTPLDGGLIQGLLSSLLFVTSIDTWWLMFFAWSLKSSVPFSGYVNTAGDKRKQVLQESNSHALEAGLNPQPLLQHSLLLPDPSRPAGGVTLCHLLVPIFLASSRVPMTSVSVVSTNSFHCLPSYSAAPLGSRHHTVHLG